MGPVSDQRTRDRSFEVWCPMCRVARVIHGAASDERYPRDANGVRWRPCPSCVPAGRDTPARLRDRDWLESMYDVTSATQIGAYLGCAGVTVSRWLRRHGIPVRTLSEATQMAWTTRSEKDAYGRNRQMVTGKGLADSRPGTVKHYG